MFPSQVVVAFDRVKDDHNNMITLVICARPVQPRPRDEGPISIDYVWRNARIAATIQNITLPPTDFLNDHISACGAGMYWRDTGGF